MKKIKLTQNKWALVDDEDYKWLSRFTWCAHKTHGGRWAAETCIQQKQIYMHRLIMGSVPLRGAIALEVDHINRKPLDNRKQNLTWVTRSENLSNRKKFVNCKQSKYTGINISKNPNNPWTAWLYRDKKKIYIGSFKTEIEAHRARLKFIKKYNKENGKNRDGSRKTAKNY